MMVSHEFLTSNSYLVTGALKLVGKLRALVPMFKLSEAAAGSEKKFSWESMARLNDFAKELRTFRVVDMSGELLGFRVAE